jgi:hypothetical protein
MSCSSRAALVVLIAALAGATITLGGSAPAAQAPDNHAVLTSHPGSCDACDLGNRYPVHPLGEAGVDSIGRTLSAYNLRLWDETDSLYNSGRFGPKGTRDARQAARQYFAVRCWNGFDYVAQGTAARDVAYSADEAALERPFGEVYCNTTVFPLRFLEQALVGPDAFCVRYEPPRSFDERTLLGGVPIRVRTDRIEVQDDVYEPALSVEFESEIHKTVELLYEHRFCGRVRQEVIVDRGDSLDLISLYDMEGLFVRKAGTHHMGAMVFWRSHLRNGQPSSRPRAGACAYFPHIAIRLPAFLPDLGLDDLRDFDLPQAILPMRWFREKIVREPDWIAADADGMLSPWHPIGPRPEILESRFPDL